MFTVSCQQNQVKQGVFSLSERDSLIETNKSRMKMEEQLIENYILRKGLHTQQTGTGLRYVIQKKGNGELAKPEDMAEVKYKVSLLNGTLCYQTEGDETITFRVDRDQVESGLHEGIKLLNPGSKALFILPSHLAHGLTGDQDKIPPSSTVIYEIELISLNRTTQK
jgi:FKBP-type peptidyl-prolyl cis-trans isomerase